jgi:hypothetical protein
MDDRRPLAFVYRELSERTIQLQSLGLRLQSTRPNGQQPSWTQADATMPDRVPGVND